MPSSQTLCKMSCLLAAADAGRYTEAVADAEGYAYTYSSGKLALNMRCTLSSTCLCLTGAGDAGRGSTRAEEHAAALLCKIVQAQPEAAIQVTAHLLLVASRSRHSDCTKHTGTPAHFSICQMPPCNLCIAVDGRQDCTNHEMLGIAGRGSLHSCYDHLLRVRNAGCKSLPDRYFESTAENSMCM